jgi:hypothetical protein
VESPAGKHERSVEVTAGSNLDVGEL